MPAAGLLPALLQRALTLSVDSCDGPLRTFACAIFPTPKIVLANWEGGASLSNLQVGKGACPLPDLPTGTGLNR